MIADLSSTAAGVIEPTNSMPQTRDISGPQSRYKAVNFEHLHPVLTCFEQITNRSIFLNLIFHRLVRINRFKYQPLYHKEASHYKCNFGSWIVSICNTTSNTSEYRFQTGITTFDQKSMRGRYGTPVSASSLV